MVSEGRLFQDFTASDAGIVIRTDAESQACQVQLGKMMRS
jgi:hypothetical protein